MGEISTRLDKTSDGMAIERDFFQDGELVRRRVVVSLGKVVGESNGSGRRRRQLSPHSLSGAFFDALSVAVAADC